MSYPREIINEPKNRRPHRQTRQLHKHLKRNARRIRKNIRSYRTPIAIFTVSLATIIYVLFFYANAEISVRFRNLLFTRKVASLEAFYEIKPSVFAIDGELVGQNLNSPVVKLWQDKVEEVLGCKNCLTGLRGIPSQQKAIEISSMMAPHNGARAEDPTSRLCGLPGGLRSKFSWLRQGHGCCSDYSEVFLAIAALIGLHAREVRTEVHSLIEFYDVEKQQWLMWDPGLGLNFTDANGNPLSLRDVCISRRNFVQPLVKFNANSPMGVTSIHDPVFEENYGSNFLCQSIGILDSSDVFLENTFLKKIGYLPKSISHLLGYLMGVLPVTLEAPVK